MVDLKDLKPGMVVWLHKETKNLIDLQYFDIWNIEEVEVAGVFNQEYVVFKRLNTKKTEHLTLKVPLIARQFSYFYESREEVIEQYLNRIENLYKNQHATIELFNKMQENAKKEDE
jgi:hypothetical protein